MPPLLRRAHIALDKAVDRLYRRAPFRFERERVEHLFKLYERAAVPWSCQRRSVAERECKFTVERCAALHSAMAGFP